MMISFQNCGQPTSVDVQYQKNFASLNSPVDPLVLPSPTPTPSPSLVPTPSPSPSSSPTPTPKDCVWSHWPTPEIGGTGASSVDTFGTKTTVLNTKSITAYTSGWAHSGTTCDNKVQTRTCNDGNLSNSGDFSSCLQSCEHTMSDGSILYVKSGDNKWFDLFDGTGNNFGCVNHSWVYFSTTPPPSDQSQRCRLENMYFNNGACVSQNGVLNYCNLGNWDPRVALSRCL
jgi:hypothetical protein